MDTTLETIGQQQHMCDTVNEGSKSEHEKCSGHFERIKVFKLWEMKNGLVDSQQLLLLQQEEHY